jgi:uncharacterized protein
MAATAISISTAPWIRFARLLLKQGSSRAPCQERVGAKQEAAIPGFLVWLACGVLAVLAAIWLGQRRVIYRPDTERVPPETEGLAGVTEVLLSTSDGERLVMWHAPAGHQAVTVLYFHGNGAGLSDRTIRIRLLQAAGYGVLIMAYRGYAGSTGNPSETANIADAKAAYAWLRATGVTSEAIVLFGESLGTGVAVQVAACEPVAAVILDSPFTSLVDVAAIHFPYLPIRLLMRDRYLSIDHIADIHVPLLIVHGEQDRVVPFVLGQRLFAAAKEPKRFVGFPGVGHLIPFDGPGWPVVRRFLDELSRQRNAGISPR